MSQPLDLALAHHQAGRLSDAERIYRQILAAEPTHPDALRWLGLVALQTGRHDAAIELIESAHRHGRPHAVSLNHLGMAYFAARCPRDARRCFAKAVALRPDYAEAHANLGGALKDLGQPKEAERSYRRSLAIKPDSPTVHYNLGNLLLALGRADEAEKSYRQAIALQPDYAEAHNNLGNALASLERREEAVRSYREALRIRPDSAEAYYNLGKALQGLGRLEEAERSYRDALALEPDAAEIRINLGNVLHKLKRYDEALQCRRELVSLRPDLAEAHFNLGNGLLSLDRQGEALQAYARAIALQPDFAAARWVFAMAQLPAVYDAEGDPERCRAAFAAELVALSQWFNAHPGHDPDAMVQQPFYLAYQEHDNRDLLARYGQLSTEVMRRWLKRERLPGVVPSCRGRLRVGIVSAYIFEHSVWNALIKGWVERLDRNRFEVEVYYLGHKQDQETLGARSHASRFEQGPKDLREWVRIILDRQPDVLIYPELGMEPTTGKLASLRLAPVQAAAWGHPETSGLPTIDYYLSAQAFEPPGAQQYYTEKLVALPGLGCCYVEPPVTPVEPDLPRLGIDPEATMLVCPGTPFKYAPQHDRVLTEIARALGRCQFVLFTHQRAHLSEKLRRRLQAAFERNGLDFGRYAVFIPWQPRAEFYGLLRRAHVLLDTIGFSGFNTAMQAVGNGLPIVTKEGRFMRGRFASGLLKRLGLSELIARSEEEYVAVAVRLARDPEYGRQVRARIEQARASSYEDLAPIRELEGFLVGCKIQ